MLHRLIELVKPLPHAVESKAMPLAPNKRNLGSLLKNVKNTGQLLFPLERVQGEIEKDCHISMQSPLRWNGGN